MSTPTVTALRTKRRVRWQYYAVGGVLYTALSITLFVRATWPVVVWICALSAAIGFWAAFAAWRRDKRL